MSEGSNTWRRIEIVHESLLTEWPRLVRWRTQDREAAQFGDGLRQAALVWKHHDRSEDFLWTGTAFREYQLWRERYPGKLSELEEAFAQAMTAEARRSSRRRAIAAGSAVATLLAVLITVVSLWRQSEQAEAAALESAHRAAANELLALGRSAIDDHPTAAVAYALASLERRDGQVARRFAVEALWRGPTAFSWGGADHYLDQSVEFSRDDRWLAVSGHAPQLWPRGGGAPVALGDGRIWDPQFSPDSQLVAYGDGEGSVFVAPLAAPHRARRLEAECGYAWADGDLLTCNRTTEGHLAISSWPPDGTRPSGSPSRIRATWFGGVDATGARLAVGSEEEPRAVRLLPRAALEAAGAPEILVLREQAPIGNGAFDPRGERVALSSARSIRLWSLVSRPPTLLRTLEAGRRCMSVAFDSAGTRIAAGCSDQLVRVWDLGGPPDAEPLVLRRGDVQGVRAAAFGPAGDWLATRHGLGVALWPVSRRYPHVVRGHGEGVTDLAFDATGKWLASASRDGTVRLWPLTPAAGDGSRVVYRSSGSHDWPLSVAVSPDGELLLVGTQAGEVVVVPRRSGGLRRLEGPVQGQPWRVGFSPDGRRAAALVDFRRLRVWEVASGRLQRLLELGADGRSDFLFTPEGRIVTASPGDVRIWSLEERASDSLLQDPGVGPGASERHPGRAIDLSRDGRYLVVGSENVAASELTLVDLQDGGARRIGIAEGTLWNVAIDPAARFLVYGTYEGEVRVVAPSGGGHHLLLGHEDDVKDVAVSPDGRWIASASSDFTIRLWAPPDLSKEPIHELPYPELLAELRRLTNLRAVADPDSASGWRLESGPFPGWAEVPEW